ncbi:MAG: hypothetical protein KIT79_04565 [Deltaproteobacteria bacterium]|nr:hypothetical protein [Deltaproteobacteria bacterium]
MKSVVSCKVGIGLLVAITLAVKPVWAGFNSELFSESKLEVLTPERQAMVPAEKGTDSIVIWPYYGTAGEADFWNRAFKDVFDKAFDSSRVDACNYRSDCEGPPSKFENERWVVRVMLKDLQNERKGPSQSYHVNGTYELFDYGKPVKTWEFSEILEVRAPIFGGLNARDHRNAQGPLAHNTAVVILDNVFKAVQERDKGQGDTSALPKIFISGIGGSDSIDNVRTAVLDAFLTAASESGTYNVITEADAKAMLTAAALQQMLGCDNENCMANIGQLVGASNVIYGSAAVVGQDLQVTASFIDSRTGKVVKRTRRTIPNRLGVIPGAVKSMFRELTR